MFPRTATVADFFIAMREQVAVAAPGPGLAVGPLYHTGPLGSVRQLGGGNPGDDGPFRRPQRRPDACPQHLQHSDGPDALPERLLALPDDVRARHDVSLASSPSHTPARPARAREADVIDWFGPVFLEALRRHPEFGTTNMITSEEWLQKPGSVHNLAAV